MISTRTKFRTQRRKPDLVSGSPDTTTRSSSRVLVLLLKAEADERLLAPPQTFRPVSGAATIPFGALNPEQ